MDKFTALVLSLVPMSPLDRDGRIQDRMLQKGNIVIPMNQITTYSVYMLLQSAPWFHEHANALWNLLKTQS